MVKDAAQFGVVLIIHVRQVKLVSILGAGVLMENVVSLHCHQVIQEAACVNHVIKDVIMVVVHMLKEQDPIGAQITVIVSVVIVIGGLIFGKKEQYMLQPQFLDKSYVEIKDDGVRELTPVVG